MARLDESRPVTNFENRYLHKDGHWVTLHWRTASRDGLYYAAARDVSKEREAHARLQVLREEAQAAAQSKGLFLVGHEVARQTLSPLPPN